MNVKEGGIMDINFCRDTHCRIQEIMDKPEQVVYISKEFCKSCRAWQYDNYLKQNKLKRSRLMFKCKTLTMSCDDLCCTFCPGANECRSACKNNPSECGQSVVIK